MKNNRRRRPRKKQKTKYSGFSPAQKHKKSLFNGYKVDLHKIDLTKKIDLANMEFLDDQYDTWKIHYRDYFESIHSPEQTLKYEDYFNQLMRSKTKVEHITAKIGEEFRRTSDKISKKAVKEQVDLQFKPEPTSFYAAMESTQYLGRKVFKSVTSFINPQPEKLLKEVSFCIPRKYREPIVRDILEDCEELKKDGKSEFRIRIQVLSQLILAIIMLFPEAVKSFFIKEKETASKE